MKKFISIALALVMCISILTFVGCKDDDTIGSDATAPDTTAPAVELTPSERFAQAIATTPSLTDSDICKVLLSAASKGSVTATINANAGAANLEASISMFPGVDTTAAFDLSISSAQDVGNVAITGSVDALINNTHLILSSPWIGGTVGVDLSKVEERLPQSIFGTETMFKLPDEAQQEIIATVNELLANLNKTAPDTTIDTNAITSAILGNLTITEEKDIKNTFNGTELVTDVITVSITKEAFIKTVTDVVKAAGLEAQVNELLGEMSSDVETSPKNYTDALNEMLADFENTEEVLQIKLTLKDNANNIYIASISHKNEMALTITCDTETGRPVSIVQKTHDEIEGDLTKTIHIEYTDNTTTLTLSNSDTPDGGKIVYDKAGKTLTLTPITNGQLMTDEAMVFGVDINSESVTFSADMDGVKVTLVIKATDTSTVNAATLKNEYKDILLMNETEFTDFVTRIQALMELFMADEEPETPEIPDVI